MTIPVQAFATSSLDYRQMAILGYTATETLLYDFGNTEDFYVYVIPPEQQTAALYNVGSSFASRWFGFNGSNGLIIVYNPFYNAVAGTNQPNPFQNADFLLGYGDGDFLLGYGDGDALYGYS